jgi:tetratricopeptide (TPR) repeat protein
MSPGINRNRSACVSSLRFSALFCVCAIAACPAWTQEPCAPPDSMKARFSGKADPTALNDLGAWFGEHDNYTCAAEAFATSLQMDPKQKDMPHVAFMFGASLYYAGDAKEAIPALQASEQSGYNEIKLHLLLARAQDDAHARPEAETEWRSALDIDPEYSYALDNLSDDLLADHDGKGAIELLDKPRLVPQRTVHQAMNLGTAYTLEGKREDAERILRDALNTYPDAVELASQLADVLTQSGKKAEAEAVLRIVKERKGGTAEAKDH